MGTLLTVVVIIVVVLFVALSIVKIVNEYERAVIFRLGRVVGVRGPGIFFLIPAVDRLTKVDLRTVTMDVPAQEVITRDNVTVRVNAVIYFRVVDPQSAVIQVENYVLATSLIAQTTLRSVLGQSELDELLSEREAINQRLQRIIDEQTDPWGVKVSIVEVKDVELPQGMQRSMSRQAEAEREKRGKIIAADGEYQAATMLGRAAEIIAQHPAALQLRYLQTLVEIAAEKNSTIFFPFSLTLRKEGDAWVAQTNFGQPGGEAPFGPDGDRTDTSVPVSPVTGESG